MTETMMIIIVAGVVIMAFGLLCLIFISRSQKETQGFAKKIGALEKDLGDITKMVFDNAVESQKADENILQYLKQQEAKCAEKEAARKAEEEAKKAEASAKALFSGAGTGDMPTTELTSDDLGGGQIGIIPLLVKCGLCASNGEARRLIQQGGIVVNDQKVTGIDTSFGLEQFTGEGLVIRKGKKVFHRAVLV